jgi:hypothetical protein
VTHDPSRRYEPSLGPYEAEPCFDCSGSTALEAVYVKRGHQLVRVCADCAVHSGDDNYAFHIHHCKECRDAR